MRLSVDQVLVLHRRLGVGLPHAGLGASPAVERTGYCQDVGIRREVQGAVPWCPAWIGKGYCPDEQPVLEQVLVQVWELLV